MFFHSRRPLIRPSLFLLRWLDLVVTNAQRIATNLLSGLAGEVLLQDERQKATEQQGPIRSLDLSRPSLTLESDPLRVFLTTPLRINERQADNLHLPK